MMKYTNPTPENLILAIAATVIGIVVTICIVIESIPR